MREQGSAMSMEELKKFGRATGRILKLVIKNMNGEEEIDISFHCASKNISRFYSIYCHLPVALI